MKNYLSFINENKKENFFYLINQGEFLICDTSSCAKSYRTFDIEFNDLAKNFDLLRTLDLAIMPTIEDFANYLSQFNFKEQKERYEKLMTNPTLRILVENKDLFIGVLKIFKPNDIRVATYKYNL